MSLLFAIGMFVAGCSSGSVYMLSLGILGCVLAPALLYLYLPPRSTPLNVRGTVVLAPKRGAERALAGAIHVAALGCLMIAVLLSRMEAGNSTRAAIFALAGMLALGGAIAYDLGRMRTPTVVINPIGVATMKNGKPQVELLWNKADSLHVTLEKHGRILLSRESRRQTEELRFSIVTLQANGVDVISALRQASRDSAALGEN
ncbi:hypothetical protein [Tsukamurella tyrosinosolvens]|uniref:hypothetical protein n=1 Tax=Tsukamurella tyrosinosolvens TaxID=57704 RepID=UPI0011C064AB|nr:hypothetical protein [Tsukamurella tyrosinosolvens]